MEEWIKIFTTTKMHHALRVQSTLKEHEIQSVILNKQDSLYMLGEIQLMVKLEQASDALILIDEENI